MRVPHARQEVYDTTRWVACWCVVSVCTRVSHAWQACNDNETVIPMCMHSDYIYIVSYNSHGHSVFINGATTVSIESEGISNPHGDAVLEPGGFLQCKLLGARGRRAGAAEEENEKKF